MSREYRRERPLAWMHMEQHRADIAYQPFQSVVSFGSGGTWGTGLGKGLQTLYLPEAHAQIGVPSLVRMVRSCTTTIARERGHRAGLSG